MLDVLTKIGLDTSLSEHQEKDSRRSLRHHLRGERAALSSLKTDELPMPGCVGSTYRWQACGEGTKLYTKATSAQKRSRQLYPRLLRNDARIENRICNSTISFLFHAIFPGFRALSIRLQYGIVHIPPYLDYPPRALAS
eukprot:scaffold3666_cov160-Amphora_coffeaeformis.AAC.13